jgi:cysteine desulfurase
MRLYFDHAASSFMLPEVIEEMQRAYLAYPGNPSSIHMHGRQARAAIEEARKTIAHYTRTSVGEIIFTSGGTEANNISLKGAVSDLAIDCVLSSRIEHPCVLRSIEHALLNSKAAVDRQFIEVDEFGRIEQEDLDQRLSALAGKKCLVSVMHANNEIGTMNDLQQIGEICVKHAAILHSDMVQTLGHFELNLTNLPVGMAAASAHKFHGPKGIGFLYLDSQYQILPLIDGGGQERNMRAGTENVAGILGMAKAFELCHLRMKDFRDKTQTVRDYAHSEIAKHFPTVKINGDPNGDSLYTVLSITFRESANTDLLIFNLDIEGISASGGSACSSGVQNISHVLEHLMPEEKVTTVRFSFGHTNTVKEVDYLLEKLAKILRK